MEKLAVCEKNCEKSQKQSLREAAFLEICREKPTNLKKSENSVVFLLELLEKKRKNREKPAKSKKIQDFIEELRDFHEKLDVSLQ